MNEVEDKETKKWSLVIGCHRGTLTSRDVGHPEEKDSLEDCQKAVKRAEEWYNSIGYFIWFASATDPEGKKHQLHPGTPYR